MEESSMRKAPLAVSAPFSPPTPPPPPLPQAESAIVAKITARPEIIFEFIA